MTDLRQAAQAVLERWDSPLWQSGTTAAAIADLRTALEQPIPTHRITSWGHCGVCRHDRIPGEGCARQECPDSPQQQAEPVAVHQWREHGCADWYDGHPDYCDSGGPYETRTLYTAQALAAQPEQEPDDGFDIDGLKDAAYALEAILQRAGEGATVGHVIALLENLAKPEQEPVETYIHHYRSQSHPNDFGIPKGHWWQAKQYADAVNTPPPKRPWQEPVAYYHPHKGFYWAKPTHISAPTVVDVPPVPLYTTPPAAKRKWQGLTEGERNDLEDYFKMTIGKAAFDAIEAKLKERNHD